MTQPRTIRALVVADTALVLALLVLLAVFVAGGDRVPTAGPSAGTPGVVVSTPPQEPGPGQDPTDGPKAFRLPSGNIACALSDEGATCTIASFTYASPAVPGCTGPTGHVIALRADGVEFDCEQDVLPTVAGADAATLEYGSSTRAGDYTCTSGTDGVTCTDGAGKGFRLARAAWVELP